MVFFDRVCDDIDAHKVIVEDEKGAYEAVKHLIDQGYKKIAHLAGPETLIISKNRINGYVKALKDHHIEVDESLMMEADNKEAGMEAMKKLLARPDRPDAIFTVNDNAAIGALQVIKRAGYKVPEDIALIGFSDDQKITSLVEPHLSSIAQPAFKIGQTAGELFLKQIETPEPNKYEKIILDTELIVRASSDFSKN